MAHSEICPHCCKNRVTTWHDDGGRNCSAPLCVKASNDAFNNRWAGGADRGILTTYMERVAEGTAGRLQSHESKGGLH